MIEWHYQHDNIHFSSFLIFFSNISKLWISFSFTLNKFRQRYWTPNARFLLVTLHNKYCDKFSSSNRKFDNFPANITGLRHDMFFLIKMKTLPNELLKIRTVTICPMTIQENYAHNTLITWIHFQWIHKTYHIIHTIYQLLVLPQHLIQEWHR